jgi:hypothetical protein
MIRRHFAERQSLGVWKKNAKVNANGKLVCTEYELTRCRGEIDWVQVVCIAHWSYFLYISAEPQFILY